MEHGLPQGDAFTTTNDQSLYKLHEEIKNGETNLIKSLPDLSDLLVVGGLDAGDLDGVGLLDGRTLLLQVGDLDVARADGVDVGSKTEKKTRQLDQKLFRM